MRDEKYLELLAEKYPTEQAVCREIINLKAILSLPKGTEHFMSDLHGEYEAFCHILNNCSGVIREKVDLLFEDTLSDLDREEICTLFGGVISGIGSGLAIRYGGAMDGIEVMAVIFAKRAGVTVGTFVMVYNIILYIICGCVLQSWVLPLYSIVAYSAALKTVDFIVEGIDRAKCAIIVTEWPHEICKVLTETFGSGITRVSAKGGYSNRDKAMLYFVVNRYQVIRMKDIVHDIDPAAFIIISEVADIFSSNNDE